MFKKVSSLFLLLASLVIFVPAANAATNNVSSDKAAAGTLNATPQIRIRIGNGHRRNRSYRRAKVYNNGYGGGRLVRQVYYVHGRPYVRYVRVW
jgi:hypothetical protein